MNEYAVGNPIKLRVYFANRDLTAEEERVFDAGGGLPAGVGVDQPVVKVDWWIGDGPTTTEQAPNIVHEATGIYYPVVVPLTPGVLSFSGYALDGVGNPLGRMLPRQFRVRTATGPGAPVP